MRGTAVFANASILLLFVAAALLHVWNEPLYYVSVQEDEYLEWATFWAFVLAAGLYFARGRRQLAEHRPFPWFVFGLSLFSLLVAMEEISWGQRLLDYKAPDYFLEENYQQELNIHNVVETGIRKLVMQLILLGYGVVLSALSLWPSFSRILERLRIAAPPPMLIVSFFSMSIIYAWYPWSHTGEWVELAMGLGFAYAALYREPPRSVGTHGTRNLSIVFLGIWLLAGVTVHVARIAHASDPERVAQAKLEVEALAEDFASGRLHTGCGIHKRLYTFLREYQQPYLLEGSFADLVRARGDHSRAQYLLDPWNSAYWIRHKCDDGRVSRFVYSFGPDRRRDSSEWQIGRTDIGAYLETEP